MAPRDSDDGRADYAKLAAEMARLGAVTEGLESTFERHERMVQGAVAELKSAIGSVQAEMRTGFRDTQMQFAEAKDQINVMEAQNQKWGGSIGVLIAVAVMVGGPVATVLINRLLAH